MRWWRRLQVAAVVVSVLAYSVLSHYSNLHPQALDLGTVLALAPMLTFGLVLLGRWTPGWIALGSAALTALLLVHFWPTLTGNFAIVYLIQQAGFYALMALTFGRSLAYGRIALCTRFADKIHGPLTPAEVHYTRNVTVAWTVFFLANLVITGVLFEFAPLRVWSLFVNFCSLPLMGLMFAVELWVRRRVLPQVQRAGLIDTLRVYFASPP